MSIPRYSREDMAHQVRRLTLFADEADEAGSEIIDINVAVLRATAAMMSEAANRAPTHQELVERIDGQLPREERRIRAAERLCRIYWDIAVAAVGEDEVRRRRDEEIARIVGAGAQA
jgi:hypothetical protein